jgi:hypothetical protein
MCHHFLILKIRDFCAVLLPTVKKIVYILLERMLIFPSVLCSPRASPSGYKLHLRKYHAFLSLNITGVFFKFGVEVGVELSVVNALYRLRFTDQLFKSYVFTRVVRSQSTLQRLLRRQI